MSGEEKAANERQIRRAAIFGMLYGQSWPAWRRSFPVYLSLACFDGLPSEIKAADLVAPKPEGTNND